MTYKTISLAQLEIKVEIHKTLSGETYKTTTLYSANTGVTLMEVVGKRSLKYMAKVYVSENNLELLD